MKDSSKTIPDFMKYADNVYLTDKYIVKQDLTIVCNTLGEAVVFSIDTFYLRTPKREEEYFSNYSKRTDIKGKRVISTMYSRRYKE